MASAQFPSEYTWEGAKGYVLRAAAIASSVPTDGDEKKTAFIRAGASLIPFLTKKSQKKK
jgi:hypothetical protein